MGPAAPAPLTRAAARSSALGRVDKAGDRAHLLHRVALCGGAFAGALIVLAIAGLAGVPHPGSPPTRSIAENIVVPAPRPAAVSPSPDVSPRATPTPMPSDGVADSAVAIAPESPATQEAPSTPEPAPSAPAPETGAATDDSSPGKSASAPGRTKAPKEP